MYMIKSLANFAGLFNSSINHLFQYLFGVFFYIDFLGRDDITNNTLFINDKGGTDY